MATATVSLFTPDADPRIDYRHRHDFRIGMPSLTFSGLSENWLLRTCGDVHWQAICASCGCEPQDITDASGARLYPSFVEVLLSGGPLARFEENDDVSFQPRVRSLSRRRVWSRQRVETPDGKASIMAEMLTIFMRRREARSSNTGLQSGMPDLGLALPMYDAAIDRARIIGPRRPLRTEAEDRASTPETMASPSGPARRFTYKPCPLVDFNGAQLLYFANYQEIIDRAEWFFFEDWPLESYTTSLRHIQYLGNIDARDTIRVSLLQAQLSETFIRHETVMTRASDGKSIAHVVTEKRRA